MTRWQANLVLLIAAAVWGASFVIQSLAMETIGPMAFTAIKFIFGAIAVAPLAFLDWRKLQRGRAAGIRTSISKNDWFGMLLIGTCLFAGAYIQQYGIIYTTVTNAGFLTAFYVLLVPLFGVLLFRRRVHWSVWPAGISCVMGAAILSGAYKGIFGIGEGFILNIGDFWVMVSAIFWALHVLLVGVYGQRIGAPALLAFMQFVTVAVISTVLTFATEEITLTMIYDSFWMLLYAGCISTAIGFTCQIYGQRYTGPADAAIILSMETVFAAAAGFVFLGERLGLIDIFGCSMILVAVFLVELTPMLTRGWRKRWGKSLKGVP